MLISASVDFVYRYAG